MVKKKSKKNGVMLRVSPFDYWKIQRDYNSQLEQSELDYLNQFDNEFVCGWFFKDRTLLHQNEDFVKNSLKELRKDKERYNAFLRDKRKWEKKREKTVTQGEFFVQKIKQEAWSDTNSRRHDCFALNYRNTAADESKSVKSKNEKVLEGLTDNTLDVTEFQKEFLVAYIESNSTVTEQELIDYQKDSLIQYLTVIKKDKILYQEFKKEMNKLECSSIELAAIHVKEQIRKEGQAKILNFLIEWLDFAIDIEEVETAQPHIFPIGLWWEKLKEDHANHSIRVTFFRVLMHRLAVYLKEKCETKNETYLIYENIIKVFKNYYNNKEQCLKGNISYE
jgi:hypothetical protein